jgi:hypothetical protein
MMSDMDYKQKYLKYKNKYLDLKNEIKGGATEWDDNIKATDIYFMRNKISEEMMLKSNKYHLKIVWENYKITKKDNNISLKIWKPNKWTFVNWQTSVDNINKITIHRDQHKVYFSFNNDKNNFELSYEWGIEGIEIVQNINNKVTFYDNKKEKQSVGPYVWNKKSEINTIEENTQKNVLSGGGDGYIFENKVCGAKRQDQYEIDIKKNLGPIFESLDTFLACLAKEFSEKLQIPVIFNKKDIDIDIVRNC